MVSLEQYCNERLIWLKKNWQMLPIHPCLLDSEPIPLPTIVKKYEGKRHIEKDDQTFLTPQEAVDFAIKKQRVTFILGEPGAGKTAATKWIAKSFSEQCLQSEGSEGYLPVWVDLASYSNIDTLEQILSRERSRIPDVSGKMKILWVLDGFDVLLGHRRVVASHFIEDANDLRKESFIVSSRPSSLVDDAIATISTELRIELQRLTPELSKQWMSKYCKDAMPAYDRFVGDNPIARGLVNVPLFFSMVVSATIDQTEVDPPLRIDEYSGRAGMFRGFVQYALELKHLDYDTRYQPDVVAKVFYGAIMAGYEDRFPTEKAKELLKQFESEHQFDAWNASVEVLCEAGLLERDGYIKVRHQQFAEYWAACYLACRIEQADKNGYLAAELWDHYYYQRLDSVLGQALAIAADKIQVSNLLGMMGKEYSSQRISLYVQIGPPEAVAPLIELLRDPAADDSVRRNVASALGKLGSPEAVLPLIELLRDPSADDYDRGIAAEALGDLGSPEAVLPLIELLRDPAADDSVRGRAAHVLGKLGSPEAILPLIDILRDPAADKSARHRAAYALGRLGSTKVILSLIELLRDPTVDNFARHRVVDAFGNMSSPEAILPLIELLRDSAVDDFARHRAAEALGDLGSPEALLPLIELLRDPTAKDDTRGSAAYALGKLGSPEAVLPLIEFLRDPSASVSARDRAASALGKLGSPEAVLPLIELLRDPSADASARGSAAEALGKLGSPEAVLPLIEFLRDPSASVSARGRAAYALGDLGSPEALLPLIEFLRDPTAKDDTRGSAAYVLGELGSPEAISPLIEFLRDPSADDSAHGIAAEALGKLGSPEAVLPLIEFLRDPSADDYARGIAAEALGDLGSSDAENILKMLVESDIDFWYVYIVAHALGHRVCPPSMRDMVEQQQAKRQAYLQSTGSKTVNINIGTNFGVVNTGSILGNINQTISQIGEVDQKQIEEKVSAIKQALQQAEENGQKNEAVEVSNLLKALLEQAKAPQANSSLWKLTKEGIVGAAKTVTKAGIAVLPLITELIKLLPQ